MNWMKLGKPAFVLKNFVRGFFHGTIDEVKSTFTNAEISRFRDTAEMLDHCKPRENHLKRDGYYEINKALKKRDYSAARKAVTKHATETVDPSCITILNRESLPERIVAPK